jgi:pimeloyl-ACP methyl ester carboxylesterase
VRSATVDASSGLPPYREGVDSEDLGAGITVRLGQTHAEVPTAVALFPAEFGARPPRSWVERAYHLTRYTVMPRGGHFAPHEEPELLADDLAAFFRPLTGGPR